MDETTFYRLMFWAMFAVFCVSCWLDRRQWRALLRVCNQNLATAKRANATAGRAIRVARWWRAKYEAMADRFGEPPQDAGVN